MGFLRMRNWPSGSKIQKQTAVFSLLLAPLFTFIALLQMITVRHGAWSAMQKEQEAWANDIASEIAYTNRWNLRGYRNASIVAPAWYVITSNGIVIEIEGYVSGVFQNAKFPYASAFEEPQSIDSEIGESWRTFAKRIQGGMVVVGIPTGSNSPSLDSKLRENVAIFPTNVDEAAKMRSRNVDADVDYAIIRDTGELVGAWGGIPLKIDPSVFVRFPTGQTKKKLNGKSYAIFSKPIKDVNDQLVGSIMIPRDVTPVEAALHTELVFNVSAIVTLWLLVVLSSIPFVHTLISRQQRLSGFKELLRNQKLSESQKVEFKPAFQWDSRVKQKSEQLKFEFLLKPVAAFLNSEGGTLFIGVNKNGSVCGIDDDLAVVNGSTDRLELEMMGLISSKIGRVHSKFVRIYFEPLNSAESKLICIVDVDPAPHRAFLRWGGDVYFFKRSGNQSQPLDRIEQDEYSRIHWD